MHRTINKFVELSNKYPSIPPHKFIKYKGKPVTSVPNFFTMNDKEISNFTIAITVLNDNTPIFIGDKVTIKESTRNQLHKITHVELTNFIDYGGQILDVVESPTRYGLDTVAVQVGDSVLFFNVSDLTTIANVWIPKVVLNGEFTITRPTELQSNGQIKFKDHKEEEVFEETIRRVYLLIKNAVVNGETVNLVHTDTQGKESNIKLVRHIA